MNKYYDGSDLLARHFAMNFVCGDRFGGKSTFWQRYVIRKAIKSGFKSQFAVIVRYDRDIKTLCSTYFDNTMMMWYPDYELEYKDRKFFMRRRTSLANPKKEPWKLVGYGFALNMATKMKSTSYPFIQTMLMEEFMNLEDKYIKSASSPELEVELLISLYATVARGNGHQVRTDCRVICISNNFYINNPYFRYYRLIDRIVKNPFQRFYTKNTEPKCIVEMTHNDVHLDIGRDGVNKGGSFAELQNELKIKRDPKINNVLFQLSFDNKEFLNVANYNDSLIVFTNGNKIRPECPVFSCSTLKKNNIAHIDVFRKYQYSDMFKSLLNEMENNRIWYDRLETFVLLYSILKF